ncbi:hypothetical protein H4I96_02558 [Botrytis cinerea]
MAPTGIYSRLKALYTGEKDYPSWTTQLTTSPFPEKEVPPFSTTTAVSLLVLLPPPYLVSQASSSNTHNYRYSIPSST